MSRMWDLLSDAPRRTLGDLDRRAGPTPRTPRSLPEMSAGVFPPSGSRWASTPAN
jgi:hypothetical protein